MSTSLLQNPRYFNFVSFSYVTQQQVSTPAGGAWSTRSTRCPQNIGRERKIEMQQVFAMFLLRQADDSYDTNMDSKCPSNGTSHLYWRKRDLTPNRNNQSDYASSALSESVPEGFESSRTMYESAQEASESSRTRELSEGCREHLDVVRKLATDVSCRGDNRCAISWSCLVSSDMSPRRSLLIPVE